MRQVHSVWTRVVRSGSRVRRQPRPSSRLAGRWLMRLAQRACYRPLSPEPPAIPRLGLDRQTESLARLHTRMATELLAVVPRHPLRGSVVTLETAGVTCPAGARSSMGRSGTSSRRLQGLACVGADG